MPVGTCSKSGRSKGIDPKSTKMMRRLTAWDLGGSPRDFGLLGIFVGFDLSPSDSSDTGTAVQLRFWKRSNPEGCA